MKQKKKKGKTTAGRGRHYSCLSVCQRQDRYGPRHGSVTTTPTSNHMPRTTNKSLHWSPKSAGRCHDGNLKWEVRILHPTPLKPPKRQPSNPWFMFQHHRILSSIPRQPCHHLRSPRHPLTTPGWEQFTRQVMGLAPQADWRTLTFWPQWWKFLMVMVALKWYSGHGQQETWEMRPLTFRTSKKEDNDIRPGRQEQRE